MKLKTQGFTLIELVIVIIVLAAIGIATSTYISTGVSIYTDISERDRELNSTRFVMERLRREVLNALPNSLIVSNSQKCLEFTPVIASTLYDYDFPISPMSASSATVAFPVTSFNNKTVEKDDLAVVYLLEAGELITNPASSTQKIYAINGINNGIITFKNSADVSFTLGSPSKRLYIIRDTIKYCFSGTNLYRTKNSDAVLMADNISGAFTAEDPTLQRNGLAKVTFMLDFDGQEAPIEQTLHVNNVP